MIIQNNVQETAKQALSYINASMAMLDKQKAILSAGLKELDALTIKDVTTFGSISVMADMLTKTEDALKQYEEQKAFLGRIIAMPMDDFYKNHPLPSRPAAPVPHIPWSGNGGFIAYPAPVAPAASSEVNTPD